MTPVRSLLEQAEGAQIIAAIRDAGLRAIELGLASGRIDGDPFAALRATLGGIDPSYRSAADPGALARSFAQRFAVHVEGGAVLVTDQEHGWTLPLRDPQVRLVLAAQHDDLLADERDPDSAPLGLTSTTWRRIVDSALLTIEISARAEHEREHARRAA